jgi:putative ABC transport system substrate-binding protein
MTTGIRHAYRRCSSRVAHRSRRAAIRNAGDRLLNGASPDVYKVKVAAFRRGLEEGGYIEGQNAAIEFRWAEGHYDRVTAMAVDLPQRGVAVLAATSTPAVLVAMAATKTIPIVFTTGGDPVELGLVASWSRPGARSIKPSRPFAEKGRVCSLSEPTRSSQAARNR